MAMLFITKFILRLDIGLGLLNYLFLISMLCALSSSFTIFASALFKKSETANMAVSSIVVLTSILAGSFYSFDKDNKLLEYIITVLPQKSFLSISNLLEQGKGICHWFGYGLYIILLILALFIFAVIKTKRAYINRK